MCAAWRIAALLMVSSIAWSWFSETALAGSLKVYPVRIVLTPKESVQTLTVHNAGDAPSRVQLRVYAWRQQDGEDVFEETRDVLANPPLFELSPEDEQIARFGLRTAPGAVEKSYRLFLEEVPTGPPAAAGEVQTLLRISIPIFVPAPNAAPRLSWRAWPVGARRMAFAIHNDGTAHVQLNRLVLTRGGARLGAADISIYVLPGSSKRVELDVNAAARPGQAVKLEALTDHGTVSADLVTEARPCESGRR